jgi:hypothetical protein
MLPSIKDMTLEEAHKLTLVILKQVMEEKLNEHNVQLAQVRLPPLRRACLCLMRYRSTADEMLTDWSSSMSFPGDQGGRFPDPQGGGAQDARSGHVREGPITMTFATIPAGRILAHKREDAGVEGLRRRVAAVFDRVG